MPLNPQDHQLHTADKVKYLFLAAEDQWNTGTEYLPHLYIEARIDFCDVRTGFRETVSLSKALEIYSDSADLLWADDMIRDVDPQKLTSFAPDHARLRSLPEFVDANFISRMETQFLQYLLRSFVTTVHRNFTLDIYSFSGETPHDFILRCRELLDGPMRRELDLLREVFNRKLEQITAKYLHADYSGQLEDAKADSQNNDIFFRYSERIAELFLDAEPMPHSFAESLHYSPDMQELEEQLIFVELDARRAIAKLEDSYAEKARSIDEYILHPNLKDIHFVRSCILWMPGQAA
jgi:hypothetical protein